MKCPEVNLDFAGKHDRRSEEMRHRTWDNNSTGWILANGL